MFKWPLPSERSEFTNSVRKPDYLVVTAYCVDRIKPKLKETMNSKELTNKYSN